MKERVEAAEGRCKEREGLNRRLQQEVATYEQALAEATQEVTDLRAQVLHKPRACTSIERSEQ